MSPSACLLASAIYGCFTDQTNVSGSHGSAADIEMSCVLFKVGSCYRVIRSHSNHGVSDLLETRWKIAQQLEARVNAWLNNLSRWQNEEYVYEALDMTCALPASESKWSKLLQDLSSMPTIISTVNIIPVFAVHAFGCSARLWFQA